MTDPVQQARELMVTHPYGCVTGDVQRDVLDPWYEALRDLLAHVEALKVERASLIDPADLEALLAKSRGLPVLLGIDEPGHGPQWHVYLGDRKFGWYMTAAEAVRAAREAT